MTLSEHEQRKVLVIGGGASGMVAAIEAVRYGARVVLLEKENRVGKKLLATGNGRCNFLNMQARDIHFHGQHKDMVQSVLHHMPVQVVKQYFELMGITPKVEEDGKVYPYSDQGSNVLDLLRYEMDHLGVEVITDEKVVSLSERQNGWIVKAATGKEYTAHRVVLATGGKAGSQFGADDSGYALAAGLGHTITPLYPALVQIKLKAHWLKTLKGVKWQGAASVVIDGTFVKQEAGELLFTDYGISGPPVLQLSRQVHEHPDQSHELCIHLLPHWTRESIYDQLMTRFHLDPDKPVELCLVGLFHKRLISVLLKEAGITELMQPAHQVPVKHISRLAEICQEWKVPITGTLSWNQAQVTAGGIETSEIDPVNLLSKRHSGLYITGELMDVDGDCGGFNLYWAWATGIIAGRHAASGKEISNDSYSVH